MKQAKITVGDECHICKEALPPSSCSQVSEKSASLRSAKSNSGPVQRVNWIKCDSCKKCHSVCCGLLRKEYTKLSKENQFFKFFVVLRRLLR